jgi:nicotinic acid mononucleotide adenylyltransferase
VLVATGSFNPPTYMHLRMFGMLQKWLISAAYQVLPEIGVELKGFNLFLLLHVSSRACKG